MARLHKAHLFGKLDLLQGCCQCPVAVPAQGVFTCSGLFTPTRVPQGVLNATVYLLTQALDGLNGMVWFDDIVYWELNEADLIAMLDAVLGRLEDAGLFAAAHKRTFSILQ